VVEHLIAMFIVKDCTFYYLLQVTGHAM